MMFTSTRRVVLSGGGHILTFEKGDSQFVPPVLRQEALAQGLEPTNAADAKTLAPVKVNDDGERIKAIKGAMKQIAQRNSAGDFDASGTPKLRAIEALSGGPKPTDNRERMALWAEVLSAVET